MKYIKRSLIVFIFLLMSLFALKFYISTKNFRGVLTSILKSSGLNVEFRNVKLIGFNKIQIDNLKVKDLAGNVIRRNFTQDYWVTGGPKPETYISPDGMQKTPAFEGMATIAADLMNVLYAGFDNPITISIPNTAQNDIQASMSGGSLISRGGGKFVARPTSVGNPVTISVSAKGRKIGEYKFRVRKLPDPAPYIAMGGDRFKSGGLSKAALMSAAGIHAAIDDGLLDIPFTVTSFRTVFFDNLGNAVPLSSNGSQFSAQQKEQFRHLSRNKRFYITNVVVHGPDGTTRTLNGRNMEVIVQ